MVLPIYFLLLLTSLLAVTSKGEGEQVYNSFQSLFSTRHFRNPRNLSNSQPLFPRILSTDDTTRHDFKNAIAIKQFYAGFIRLIDTSTDFKNFHTVEALLAHVVLAEEYWKIGEEEMQVALEFTKLDQEILAFMDAAMSPIRRVVAQLRLDSDGLDEVMQKDEVATVLRPVIKESIPIVVRGVKKFKVTERLLSLWDLFQYTGILETRHTKEDFIMDVAKLAKAYFNHIYFAIKKQIVAGMMESPPGKEENKDLMTIVAILESGPIFQSLLNYIAKQDADYVRLNQVMARVDEYRKLMSSEELRVAKLKSFEASLSDLFATFDNDPLASTIATQVHFAKLQDHRRRSKVTDVVVKLKRGYVEDTMKTEELFFQKLLIVKKFVREESPLHPLLQQIRAQLSHNLDLNVEAQNLLLGQDYYHLPNAGIHVIKLLGQFPRHSGGEKHALVMEPASGRPLSEIVSVIRNDPNMFCLMMSKLDMLFRVWFRESLYDSGFFHHELNADTLYFSRQKKTLTIINFATTSTLTRQHQKRILDIIIGILYRDTELVLRGLGKGKSGNVLISSQNQSDEEVSRLYRSRLLDKQLLNSLEEQRVWSTMRKNIKSLFKKLDERDKEDKKNKVSEQTKRRRYLDPMNAFPENEATLNETTIYRREKVYMTSVATRVDSEEEDQDETMKSSNTSQQEDESEYATPMSSHPPTFRTKLSKQETEQKEMEQMIRNLTDPITSIISMSLENNILIPEEMRLWVKALTQFRETIDTFELLRILEGHLKFGCKCDPVVPNEIVWKMVRTRNLVRVWIARMKRVVRKLMFWKS